MSKEISYKHNRVGDTIKVVISDCTHRVIYRSEFNIRDKNAIFSLLSMLEKFGGYSIINIIETKIGQGEWF